MEVLINNAIRDEQVKNHSNSKESVRKMLDAGE